MNLKQNLEETHYSPVSQPPPARQEEAAVEERVTAQEFARALASLEAQREQTERELQNTVPIGDALKQLDINVSAAEILAEVQIQRQRQAGEQEAALRRMQLQRKRRRRGLAFAGVLGLCLGGYALTSLLQGPAPAIAPPTATVTTPPIVTQESPPGELRTLAEIPDGQFVQCTPNDLFKLLRQPKASLSDFIVQTFIPTTPTKWLLVKHDGHAYLRGYMAAMSPQAMAQLKSVQVFAGKYDKTGAGGMAYLKPITLRLGSFAWKNPGDEAQIPYVNVSNVHLDRYANERPDF